MHAAYAIKGRTVMLTKDMIVCMLTRQTCVSAVSVIHGLPWPKIIWKIKEMNVS
jgi:hypothetical protein